MTLTIDANVVWKPRNILRVVVAKVDEDLKSKHLQTVLMRVLHRFPDAWQAVMDALKELETGQPWTPFPEMHR